MNIKRIKNEYHKRNKLKASFTVESSVVVSAAILIIAAVIMFGITLRGNISDMCNEQLDDEVRCIDVMNGREADLSKSYERAPDILYKNRLIRKAAE